MAVPMMRYPGLLASAQYMTPPAVDRRLAPPFAPPMPMAPAGGFDPFATKPSPPSVPPYSGAPRGVLERLVPKVGGSAAYDFLDRNRMALVAGFMNSVGQDGSRDSMRGLTDRAGWRQLGTCATATAGDNRKRASDLLIFRTVDAA